ncbi:MAG TPA: efflux RND transporter periplasmic adaptor subunit [Chitinophagaceae bacterium]|nr:efflux RND transporter periplasmic adaptor subunit [Chitinophagaceae bacterium]
MKQFLIITAVIFLASCGGGSSSEGGNEKVSKLKTELDGLKKQRDGLNEKITALEAQLKVDDPNGAGADNAKLVEVTELQPQNFEHFIDLQGRIATENIYYVTPRGMGGQVKAVYVKQGDRVKNGQLLIKLDDAVVRQQKATLQTQLNYARDLYNRQQNIWKEGIGTEVQVLNARNAVENLEKQMSVLDEQLSMTNVYAQASGIAETVNIRVGETFTGSPLTGITIVNPTNLKAVVDIPENYIAKVQKGMPVVVELPDIKKTYRSTISLVSEVIGQNNRSFTAETKIPSDPMLKPNQVAIVKILDHASKGAMVAPVATIQTDEKGKFVFVLEQVNGKPTARKKAVVLGELYDENVEIKSGLSSGEKLITQGFQGLYDGQVITTK